MAEEEIKKRDEKEKEMKKRDEKEKEMILCQQ
jgi:hypothetical protein